MQRWGISVVLQASAGKKALGNTEGKAQGKPRTSRHSEQFQHTMKNKAQQ
jgi:hypothetical protein